MGSDDYQVTLRQGQLFVLEGPDGVGKSTLAAAFAKRVTQAGFTNELFAFPGNQEGTLGAHIYQLHHTPEKFLLTQLEASSKQVLHVAAHIDAIQRYIRPKLSGGTTIVLDRFWWSTWVYGHLEGVPGAALQKMVELENVFWENSEPDAVFLIDRANAFRREQDDRLFRRTRALYHEAADKFGQNNCHRIMNTGTVEEAASEMVSLIGTGEP